MQLTQSPAPQAQAQQQTQQQQAQAAAKQAEEGQAASSAKALSSDFETFLLMLTTQMENQDPLNPIESEDFAVQLATFSGVEQQVRTNDLLEQMASGFGGTGLAQLAGWVGMDARVTAPVAFDGTPVDLALNPAPGADGAELIVKDAFGAEVAREAVPLDQEVIQWAGIGKSGTPLPAGNYTLELASSSRGEVVATEAVPHYARITEARQGPNGVELVMAGGTKIPSDDITALRDPVDPL
ncbi:MAG: flagellar hook assembly protein FlgD [Silicimonas sp.]|nr:flagellar hook assembly protein FlgD [Silicimonas sp.]